MLWNIGHCAPTLDLSCRHRHRRDLLWDNIPPLVPDDIPACEAPEAVAAIRSQGIWVQNS